MPVWNCHYQQRQKEPLRNKERAPEDRGTSEGWQSEDKVEEATLLSWHRVSERYEPTRSREARRRATSGRKMSIHSNTLMEVIWFGLRIFREKVDVKVKADLALTVLVLSACVVRWGAGELWSTGPTCIPHHTDVAQERRPVFTFLSGFF